MGGSLDEEPLREFIATDYGRLVAGLTLLAGSQALAEEAVQEALARAWARMRNGQRIDSLGGWVAVVATNVLRTGIRRRLLERKVRERQLADRSGRTVSDESPATDRHVDLMRAFQRVPRRQRTVLALHYLVDLSVREIATHLHMSEGAVKVMLHRARHSLAAQMPDSAPDDGSEEVNSRGEPGHAAGTRYRGTW